MRINFLTENDMTLHGSKIICTAMLHQIKSGGGEGRGGGGNKMKRKERMLTLL